MRQTNDYKVSNKHFTGNLRQLREVRNNQEELEQELGTEGDQESLIDRPKKLKPEMQDFIYRKSQPFNFLGHAFMVLLLVLLISLFLKANIFLK